MNNVIPAHARVTDEPLLRVEHLTKRFPQLLANDAVSFDVRRGEVHCLLGENGAGKTTLAECLYGTYRPDGGQIHFKGQSLSLSSPKDAIRAGLGMVHQHFVLAPPLTAIENIVVGVRSEPALTNLRRAKQRLETLCGTYGIELDLSATIAQLSVGEQQWVEILKALYVGVDLLILDEPTAVLTPQKAEQLFAILRKMKADGLSVIFITHKLHEVMEVSDRVTVLRKGKRVGTLNTCETTKEELAKLMVGREVVFRLEKEALNEGPALLEVHDVRAYNDRGQEALQGVSMTLRRNEIMGLAGVSGNGQRELFEVLVGMRRATAGRACLEGEDLVNRSPRFVMERGLASVPEDRLHEGSVGEFRVDENLILGLHRQPPYAKGQFLSPAHIAAAAKESIRRFDIATPSAAQVTRTLSGGNIQKVILARELSQNPKCLVVNQPTRGLDVGATEYVHRQLLAQRQRGAGILLISEDLDEIFNLADRIAVMFKGRVVAVLDAARATLEQVGLLMAGSEAAP